MQRFFLDYNFFDDEIILNDFEIYHQITKVMRSKIGDRIIFFNSQENIDFIYKIISIDKKNIIFSLEDKIKKQTDKLSLNLYQSIPNKIDKIELILQKGVEVGYNNFYFFRSERSQDLNLTPNKVDRFKKIILEAVEQSGRNKVPNLFFLEKIDFKNIFGNKYYFHTQDENSKKLKDIKSNEDEINIFVGPEGGFSEKEVKIFDENSFTKINLGNNILRTETASIVVGFFFSQIN